jgi:hypothetical protein
MQNISVKMKIRLPEFREANGRRWQTGVMSDLRCMMIQIRDDEMREGETLSLKQFGVKGSRHDLTTASGECAANATLLYG